MADRKSLTRDEAQAQLNEAAATISLCANILRPHMELLAAYENERQLMQSVGCILDPTLFNDSERRAVEAIMTPLFDAARKFVATVDEQTARAEIALEKVKVDA